MDLRWKHPFTSIVAGPSGCGKSHFVSRFIAEVHEMCDTQFNHIYWYRPSQTTSSGQYEDEALIEYRAGLPDLNEFDGSGGPIMIVVDDMMRETNESVVDLFTKGSHHRNLSVFFITQNLFHQGRGQRDISLNAHYIVCFKNPRDRAQIKYLARQMYPDNTRFLVDAYTDATLTPHGYLVVDLKQDTPDNARVRTRVFPQDKYQYVYEPTKPSSTRHK